MVLSVSESINRLWGIIHIYMFIYEDEVAIALNILILAILLFFIIKKELYWVLTRSLSLMLLLLGVGIFGNFYYIPFGLPSNSQRLATIFWPIHHLLMVQYYRPDIYDSIVLTVIYFLTVYPIMTYFFIVSDKLKRINQGDTYYDLITNAYNSISKNVKVPKKLKFYITEEYNAFAFDGHKIAMGKPFLETALDSEEGFEVLCGVLAHECAHIKYKDIVVMKIKASCIFILDGIGKVLFFISQPNPKDPKDNGCLLALPFVLFHFFISLLVGLLTWFSNLVGGKQSEKRADLFAVKAGYGYGLLYYFESIKDEECSFWDEHPKTTRRIEYVQKAIKKYER